MKKILAVLLVFVFTFAFSLSFNFSAYAVEETLPHTEDIDGEEIEQGNGAIESAGDVVMGVINTVREYSPDDFKKIIDEHIIPWVTLAISAVLGIYVAISPILAKIKKTSNIFDKSSDKLDKSSDAALKAKEQLAAAKENIESLKEEFKEVKDGYDKMLTSLSNIEKIVRIGFENTDELVIKGYAHEIAKVGAMDEKKDNKA